MRPSLQGWPFFMEENEEMKAWILLIIIEENGCLYGIFVFWLFDAENSFTVVRRIRKR